MKMKVILQLTSAAFQTALGTGDVGCVLCMSLARKSPTWVAFGRVEVALATVYCRPADLHFGGLQAHE